MIERLFTSKTRVKLLTLFIMNPERELYIREIVRLTNENINAIRRELTNLEDIGLLHSTIKGNTKQYTLDKTMPIYSELKSIIVKTEGITKILKDHLSELGSIKCAFIYGSFAQDKVGMNSDIDLFLIASVDEKKLIPLIHNFEKQISREINYVLFTMEEFEERKKHKNPFITNVLKEPKILLIGDLP